VPLGRTVINAASPVLHSTLKMFVMRLFA